MEQNNFEKRNLIYAIIVSAALLFAVDALFPRPQKTAAPQQNVATVRNAAKQTAASVELSAENVVEANAAAAAYSPQEILPRETAIGEYARIPLQTSSLKGSIRLKGARFDDLSLSKYRETLEKNSPNIVLFSPAATEFPYFAEFGWVSNEAGLALPDADAVWSTTDKELTDKKEITLTWDNKTGLKFFRQISVDENYMFKVSDRVENYGSKPVTLFNYGLVGRTNVPPSQRGAVHEGMVGYLSGSLKEMNYDKIAKEKQASYKTTGGWAGITDKYWMAILAFDQSAPNVFVKFSENETPNGRHFQSDYLLPPTVVAPGAAVHTTAHLFAGAKEVKLIDAYEKTLGLKRFDLTVDFGWYYFLTKPFFFILSYFYSLFGNMGAAILFFAFLLRLAMFPIANKSFENMAKMKKLQPKIEALQEKYADDRMRLSEETMNLYRREKINPAAGCLPMFIQIPVFFSLYKVLYFSLELRQAPFCGWIQDLSAPDPSSVFTLFGMVNWPIPEALNIGVWPVLMGLTMWLQQQMNPKTPNKTQNMMLAAMPWVMTFLLGHLASGLVIYWTWSNILSIAQQYALKFKRKKAAGK